MACCLVQGLGNLLYMQRCETLAGDAAYLRLKGEDWVMWRIGLAVVALLATVGTANAQFWGSPYGRGGYYQRAPQGFFSPFGWDDYDRPRRYGPRVQSGGEKAAIEALAPRTVSFPSSYPVGSIVIDSKGRQLFLVTSPTEALHYPISVGREGFSWAGTETISRKAEWPDWHPPEEMRYRDWRLPEKMTGGIKNPLGAMALYLGSSLYRIHGTNDPKSIGRAASSGCFRMLNGHIVDLASRVEIGTTVQVVRRLPPELEKVVVEQVSPPTPPKPATPARRSRPS
jgi:lipoprotein-anchoring transpeptidase ErfK/SrfK